MKSSQVQDVLTLDGIIEGYPHTPDGKAGLIAALIEWRDGTTGEAAFEASQDGSAEPAAEQPAPARPSTRARRGRVVESSNSDDDEPPF